MNNGQDGFEVILSLEHPPNDDEREFAAAANTFLEQLKAVDHLDVTIPQKPEPGTRGLLAILTAIVVGGTKIGAFKAIYVLARDFMDNHKNAEIVLKFGDGSILKLKGLTREEAERKMEAHLRRSRSAKA
jgi:hypothetical protein